MTPTHTLLRHRKELQNRYNGLIEESINFRHLDEAASDVAAFKAIKVLSKINKIKFLTRQIL